MAFIIVDPIAGTQPIATTSTVQNHAVGRIVKANDPTLGSGEFIYLKGVGSTVIGSWVTFNDSFETALIATDVVGPVAVAMSANIASQWGWYQIGGKAWAVAADVSDSGKVYIDTAAGVCDDAVVAGNKVFNATWASDEDTGSPTRAYVQVNRPFATNEST